MYFQMPLIMSFLAMQSAPETLTKAYKKALQPYKAPVLVPMWPFAPLPTKAAK